MSSSDGEEDYKKTQVMLRHHITPLLLRMRYASYVAFWRKQRNGLRPLSFLALTKDAVPASSAPNFKGAVEGGNRIEEREAKKMAYAPLRDHEQQCQYCAGLTVHWLKLAMTAMGLNRKRH